MNDREQVRYRYWQQHHQYVVITFDGFYGNNGEYVVKALGIARFNDGVNSSLHMQHFDFAPPYGWDVLNVKAKQKNSYMTHSQHGLNWYSGDIAYCRLTKILKQYTDCVKHIFISGDEQMRFLRNILGRHDVQNLSVRVLPLLSKSEITAIHSLPKHLIPRCLLDHESGRDVIGMSEEERVQACCFARLHRDVEYLRTSLRSTRFNGFEMMNKNLDWLSRDDMFNPPPPPPPLQQSSSSSSPKEVLI